MKKDIWAIICGILFVVAAGAIETSPIITIIILLGMFIIVRKCGLTTAD